MRLSSEACLKVAIGMQNIFQMPSPSLCLLCLPFFRRDDVQNESGQEYATTGKVNFHRQPAQIRNHVKTRQLGQVCEGFQGGLMEEERGWPSGGGLNIRQLWLNMLLAGWRVPFSDIRTQLHQLSNVD